jgi:hypothetical protein
MGIVYYFGGGLFLVDRSVSAIGVPAAIGLSLGLLAAGWLVYTRCGPRRSAPAGGRGPGPFALIVARSHGG